ncbi:MAG: CPBP family intramembrane metalloprotease [Acidobacteria bacterium]|nr:CPBP family intramembrane metalloprotease [Acidobacteriota bacterium]
MFSVAIGSLVWLLHRAIGRYPTPLPRCDEPGRTIRHVLLLWGLALAVPVLRIFMLDPWLQEVLTDRTWRELVQVPWLTLTYLALPLLVVLRLERWTRHDLGLTWRTQSWGVALFALGFGLTSGVVPFATGQAVIGVEALPAGTLLLLLYNNDFLEEFFHRGVIQSLLERAIGQKRAVLWGGILFGLTHVVFDITRLGETGVAFVCSAVLLQTMAGWFLGIVYMKTRSLWPGVVCHYLANWLPAILVALTQ